MSASKARAFLESVAGYADAPVDEVPSQDRPVKLGTIDALYTGAGNPRVLFDGETLMGVKTYPMLQPVKALDRVALIPQGHGYIIAGAIGADPRRGLEFDTVAQLKAWQGAREGDVARVTATGDDYRRFGSTWRLWNRPPTDFIAQWTGLTVGNGSVAVARYTVAAGLVHAEWALGFGSTTAVSGTLPRPELPLVNTSSSVGSFWAFDASASRWATGIFIPGAYLLAGDVRVNATTPWAWAAGDLLRIEITYMINPSEVA